MTVHRKVHGRALVVVAVAVGLSCEPIVGAPPAAAPINSCPARPCDAYKQSGPEPTCNADGVCAVPTTTTNFILVIGLASDSYLAPGRTYLATLNSPSPAPASCQAPTCCQLQNCSPPVCALQHWTLDVSSYFIAPNATTTKEANWNLGNAGVTTLPVQATFRFRYGSSATSSQDAFDLGLPVDPVLATNVPEMANASLSGPNGSAQFQFRTYLQQGCYERTLQPFSPFSGAFPPEIKPWPQDDTPEGISDFDKTKATGPLRVIPQFDIMRAEGLDGWSAYLRDAQTKRVFSNVVRLTGSLAHNVTLLTKHLWTVNTAGQVVPDTVGDALAGLEVVLAPPPGQALPTEFFAPNVSSPPGVQPPSLELTSGLTYPSLPTPITVTGRIRTPAGTPVPANVYFTAADISQRSGQRFPANFEFNTHVSAIPDPRTGNSTYSVLLPQGDYQIVVRPTDGVNAVKAASRPVGGQGNEMTGEDFDVTPLASLSGTVRTTDGRALAEAIVEALPTQCAASLGDAAAPPVSSDECLPNAAQTVTANDGSFRLMVDPGGYQLRIRPRDGSHLPWRIQPVAVGAAAFDVGAIDVPAPMSVGMRLTDTAGTSGLFTGKNNPVPYAVVRVFTDPSQGAPAVELGRAVTDADGNYEMYIAPLDQ